MRPFAEGAEERGATAGLPPKSPPSIEVFAGAGRAATAGFAAATGCAAAGFVATTWGAAGLTTCAAGAGCAGVVTAKAGLAVMIEVAMHNAANFERFVISHTPMYQAFGPTEELPSRMAFGPSLMIAPAHRNDCLRIKLVSHLARRYDFGLRSFHVSERSLSGAGRHASLQKSNATLGPD
jgi:hypothetical protein